jgi:hypothetical protein
MVKWHVWVWASCSVATAACGVVQVKTGEEARKEIEAQERAKAEAAKAKEAPSQAEAEPETQAGAESSSPTTSDQQSHCNDEFIDCKASCARTAGGCSHCSIIEDCKSTGPNPDACYICWRKCKDQQESCFKN